MNQHHQQQWSDVVARPLIDSEGDPEGRRVALLVPRFRKGPLAKWLQPRLKRPFIRVNLDEIGSFVWQRLNATTKFDAIAEAMKGHFGSRVEPAEDRLKKFLIILHKDRFVELLAPSDR